MNSNDKLQEENLNKIKELNRIIIEHETVIKTMKVQMTEGKIMTEGIIMTEGKIMTGKFDFQTMYTFIYINTYSKAVFSHNLLCI